MRVSIEVCVESVEEARTALALGADSVEACAWLACGGITPSLGFVRQLAALAPPRLRVLVRPAPGGFTYGEAALATALDDARILLAEPFPLGVVAGDLPAPGQPMGRHWAEAIASAPGREFTFHRAIDRAPDMPAVLEACIAMGFSRVLTSGGATLAADGARRIRQLVEQAKGRVAIAAAGGISAANVVALVEATGVREVHFSARKPKPEPAGLPAMGTAQADGGYAAEPDAAKIEGVMNALVKAGLR